MGRKTQALEKAQNPQQQGHSTDNAEKPSDDLIAKSNVVPPEIKPSTNEEQHRAAERDYWRRELRVMWWLNWITLVAVVGGIISLIYIKRTLDATRTQAAIAMRQMELSERPWVTAEVALTRPFNTNDEVGIEVSVKNVGRSVALDVGVRAQIVYDPLFSAIENRTITFPSPDPSEIDVEREILCGERFRRTERSAVIEYGQSPLVLFPEQGGAIQAVARGYSGEAKKRAVRWRFEDRFDGEVVQESRAEPVAVNMFVSPVLIGCITYSSAFNERWYATEFTRIVSSITHPDGHVPVGVSVPVENIRLKPYRSNGRIHARKYID